MTLHFDSGVPHVTLENPQPNVAVVARLYDVEEHLRRSVQLIDRGFWNEGVGLVEIALKDIEVLKRQLGITPIPVSWARG